MSSSSGASGGSSGGSSGGGSNGANGNGANGHGHAPSLPSDPGVRTTTNVPEPTGSGDDRREAMRMPIELRVEYKKLNTFFADYTKNICKGGTFIRTRRPLDVGTVFVFQLAVPSLKEPFNIRGEVKWVKREGEPSPPGVAPDHEAGMGIRFIYESVAERAELEGVVERMMIESLGQLLYSKLMGKDSPG